MVKSRKAPKPVGWASLLRSYLEKAESATTTCEYSWQRLELLSMRIILLSSRIVAYLSLAGIVLWYLLHHH